MKTRVIAHRGARSLAPENTLAAARVGHAAGADLWETDVSITRDDQLILFHDATLERCTDVKKKFPGRAPYRVRDFTLNEILTLDNGSWFIHSDPFGQIQAGVIRPEVFVAFRGEPVPTLAQALDLVQELDWAVNLELKCVSPDHGSNPARISDMPGLTLETIQQSGIDPGRVCLSSFNHDWLDQVRHEDLQIPVQALVGEDGCAHLDFSSFRFDTYNVNAGLITEDQVRMLKSRGKTVNLFTINDPDMFQRFSALGVDGIFTDFPQRFAV